MNRQQFISYLERPEMLSTDSAVLLDSLVKKYPFFQTAQLLYAKNLSNQNSIQYSSQLKLAAAYSGDRKILYQLIKNEKVGATSTANHKKNAPPSVVEPVVDSIVREKEKQEKLIEQIEKLSSQLDSATKAIEIRLTDVEKKSEEKPLAEKKEDPQPITVKPPKDIPLLYKIEAAFDKGQQLAVEVGNIDNLTKEVINEAIDASVEVQMSQMIYEENLKKQNQKPKADAPPNLDKNVQLPFGAWLKNTKRFESEKEVSRQQIYNLIDEFTRKSEAEKLKPKATFFSPENMAKKSVELDETIITETLAKILVKQKEFTKAIRAYEMLSLKYPEKNAFFATQIIEIQKLKST